jgi:two-component system, chemotaxis family, CheB/CheR fusion protein
MIGLIFHELATNAVKYGALHADSGRIDLSWQEQAGTIRVHWRETGVAVENTSPKRGVGSGIIADTLPYMLGGAATLTFHADGLECVLEFPSPPEASEVPPHG